MLAIIINAVVSLWDNTDFGKSVTLIGQRGDISRRYLDKEIENVIDFPSPVWILFQFTIYNAIHIARRSSLMQVSMDRALFDSESVTTS